MCARDRIQDAGEVMPQKQSVKTTSVRSSGRNFRYLKQKHNIQNVDCGVQDSAVTYKADWMALSTMYSKRILQIVNKKYEQLTNSRFARFLPGRKAVSHTILITALSVILFTFINKQNKELPTQQNKGWTFVYILSVAMHFGVQIWMTLVSGLVLYFNLPRHTFGQVQQNLFPAYYVHCTILSFVMVISFIQAQPEIHILSKEFFQLLAISLTFVIELTVRLYISKEVVMLKHLKTKMEAAAGFGQEVGQHVLGDLANCPHYMKILKKFRLLHSYTAVGTILTVLCSIYHLNYLSEKICL